MAASTAAAVTQRIQIGFAVMLLALRHPARTVKQLTSLQVISRGRLVLGVGGGGENPPEWQAATVPIAERGRRTDAILAALPEMLQGRRAELADPVAAVIPELAPTGASPPIWIGGRSDSALRRGQGGDKLLRRHLVGPVRP